MTKSEKEWLSAADGDTRLKYMLSDELPGVIKNEFKMGKLGRMLTEYATRPDISDERRMELSKAVDLSGQIADLLRSLGGCLSRSIEPWAGE